MNKRQKKKLKRRWGIFHYREYHELRKEFADYIIKYHIDPLLNEGHNPVIIRKWFILEMWKAFVKTRKFRGLTYLTYKHLRFARNLPKEVDGKNVLNYKPLPPIVSLYAREQLSQFEPINTLEVLDNEQTSKEETQET
jgi:hypothetical protein